jgi:hypothetical protein
VKVYIAGPWEDRHLMPHIAEKFEAAGHVITERWWEKEDRPGFKGISNEPNDYLEERAIADFTGVVKAAALVLVNTRKSEGKAVEMGIALGAFKPVVLIGTRSNIFHYLPSVYPVPDVDAALELLS